MSDILEDLRQPLVMSMFRSKQDLYQEGERQRAEAAAEIERLRADLQVVGSYRLQKINDYLLDFTDDDYNRVGRMLRIHRIEQEKQFRISMRERKKK